MHNRRSLVRRLCTSSILPGGLLFLSLLTPGCGSEKTLSISPDPYRGPTLTVDTTGTVGGQHFAIFLAPTGGWAVQLDRTQREVFSMQAFITARRPNPAFAQTQAIVEHRIATGIPSTTPLWVYVRVLDYNQRADDEPYLAVTSGNVNASPVPPPQPGSSAPR